MVAKHVPYRSRTDFDSALRCRKDSVISTATGMLFQGTLAHHLLFVLDVFFFLSVIRAWASHFCFQIDYVSRIKSGIVKFLNKVAAQSTGPPSPNAQSFAGGTPRDQGEHYRAYSTVLSMMRCGDLEMWRRLCFTESKNSHVASHFGMGIVTVILLLCLHSHSLTHMDNALAPVARYKSL